VTVGVAIVGCGLIGRKRASALPPGFEVVAVHDTILERADLLATGTPGGVTVARTVDEAVAARGVALVIVATTHGGLSSVALAALDAGRDVLLEKPGARTNQELLAVRGAAEEAGRQVRVGYNHRFHPSFRKMRELLAEYDYGPLMHVRARYGHGGRVGYAQEWRADRARSGGGELLDQGSHLIDLTRMLTGDVDLVFSELRTDFWPADVEDNAFLALRPVRGGFAWLHASWTEWRNLFSFEVAYRDAKLEVQGLGGSYGVERLTLYEMLPEMGPPVTTAWEFPRVDESWALELEDVAAALRGDVTVGASLDDALAVFSLIEQAYDR
jgi:predicted dehydrogenase